MADDSFQLTFDGQDVRNGAINVFELAPALTAMGNLVRDANRFLNRDQATVDLKVESDFEPGSFHVHLLLNQTLPEAVRDSFAFAAVIDSGGIIHALFGVVKEHADKVITGTMLGLFGIWKLLKGERPKPNSITITENHGVIKIGDTEVKVDARGAQMYLNDVLRSDVDHVARSVAKDGLDRLEVS